MKEFRDIFGQEAQSIGEAHGRLNIMGDTADSLSGCVLSLLIPQYARVLVAPRSDNHVHVFSRARADEIARFQIRAEKRLGRWSDDLQGVSVALRETGHEIRGFNALIESDIPMGEGLASGVALKIALLRALRESFSLELSDTDLSRIAFRAESEWGSQRIEPSDPVSVAFGDENTALLVDRMTLQARPVTIDPTMMRLFVIQSGVRHRNALALVQDRRAQCQEACRVLGIRSLEEISIQDIDKMQKLPDNLLRRVRHVASENARVNDAVIALQAGDVRRLGRLMSESHASLRDDFDVSLREIDLLTEIAMEQPEVRGARLSGGGFGGAVIVLADPQARADVAVRIARRYQHLTGRDPHILIPAGAGHIESPRQHAPQMWDLGHI